MAQPDILFQDKRYIIINKPAGLPVHAGPRGGPSVEDWFAEFSRRRNGPWLVHRLDADTAGCLVIALTKPALLAAQAAFHNGTTAKIYWAVVGGAPSGDAGTIDAPLLKKTAPSGWRVIVDASGQRAVSAWRLISRGTSTSLLEIRPQTGRTHQVRVHCAALGCPIVGDTMYGGGDGRLHLLARAITVPVEPVLSAIAPVPAHMQDAVKALGCLAWSVGG